MDSRTGCFVSGCLAAVLHVSRFVGIAPLRFVKKPTGWHVSPSAGWSIYGYVIVTICNLMTIGNTISELLLAQEKSIRMRTPTQRVVCIVDAGMVMVIAGAAVYGASVQMRSMIACINHVQKMNCELNVHHHKPMFSEKKKIVLFIVWLIITVSFPSAENLVFMLNYDLVDKRVCMLYWFYYVCFWIMEVRMILFAVITLHVMRTFKAINDCLRTLLNQQHGGVKSSVVPQQQTVRRVSSVYASACAVVREVDARHGLVVLTTLGFCLLYLVVTAYLFIKNLITENNDWTNTLAMQVTNGLIFIFWFLFHFFNLIICVEPCHLTHVEMETTRELVSELMMHCSDSNHGPLAMELDLFYRQLLLNQPFYSPLRVITLSRSLVLSILGGIITYLVIMLQY